jgi:hypothetical protein
VFICLKISLLNIDEMGVVNHAKHIMEILLVYIIKRFKLIKCLDKFKV